MYVYVYAYLHMQMNMYMSICVGAYTCIAVASCSECWLRAHLNGPSCVGGPGHARGPQGSATLLRSRNE